MADNDTDTTQGSREYNEMMGRVSPAHLGSQSSAPGKEDAATAGYHNYIDQMMMAPRSMRQ